jgi:long-chain acyl-CoA synthetase
MPNLALALSETAVMYPTHPAIRMEKTDLSYAEVDRASAQVAGLLRSRGLQPGDRAGVMLPNVPAFAVVYHGVLRAGAVVVPMNPLLKEREVEYYVQDSGARFLFAWHEVPDATTDAARAAGTELIVVGPGEFERKLATLAADPDIASRAAEDTAVILYTSGTTGHPKGAELTHFNLSRNAQVMATTLLGLDTSDVILGCLPFFHAFGQTCCLNAAIQAGATVTLMSRFNPSGALDIIASEGVTVFEGVPDRKKDLIIRGGFNVYPREVEEVLYEHPAVREAAVIGLPHDSLGEEIGAAVALREGHSASPEELQQFVKARLAAYKYPRKVWLVESLPQGPTGKIMRRLVTAPKEASTK